MSNAVMFHDLSDSDITEIETFVRERLFSILKTKANFNETESNMAKYFSMEYASCPDQFKFQIGDKKLIRMAQTYVKEEVAKKSDLKTNDSMSKVKNDNTEKMSDDTKRTLFFLNKLNAATDRNSKRKKGGYRYDADIKLFSAYLRTIVGRLGYETIQKNLPCALPSLPSTNRYIQASNCRVHEGVLRSEELLVHLSSRNLPLVVSISEDATRITGQVQYDSVTNQLVGFALPINKTNGMPIPLSFPARNSGEILSHFTGKNEVANFLNIIMAQPLADVPPFCLMVYGSDNKYNAQDVINRWNHIIAELKRLNINVLTVSSDSDPRYNSAMRQLSKLGNKNNFMRSWWFSCGDILNRWAFFVQDIIHIATKLRNFLLRTLLGRKIVPFGNKFITVKHLFTLLVMFTKDVHQLTETVLNPKDKQNFESVRRMCDAKVIDLLKKEVINSEATALFLEMIRDIVDSYTAPNLMPLERIEKIFYPTFILRIWRDYISKSKKYNLENNFLTMNCYSCIELNAHSLIQIMLYLKENNMEHLFMPTLYSSQQCESTFRQLRSFSSTFSTVTNCTVKGALSRINRIQYLNEVRHLTKFCYPRLANQNDTVQQHKLPSQQEISDVIARCKSDAINMAAKFGLISKKSTKAATTCNIKTSETKPIKRCEAPVVPIRNFSISDFKNIALKDYSLKKNEPITEDSPYIEFLFDTKRVVVKKSSFCWLLRGDAQKLSNDRLLRVQANKKNKPRAAKHITTVATKKKITLNANMHGKCKY